MKAKLGHGDHWLAALEQGDPRLVDALAAPLDAPDAVALHRFPLTSALDMVQVTARHRLVTAYPEPRATTPATLRPVELNLWETGIEGWLTAEHVHEHGGAGVLTLFLTDLAERATDYQRAGKRRGLDVELAALATRSSAPWSRANQGSCVRPSSTRVFFPTITRSKDASSTSSRLDRPTSTMSC